MWILGFFYEELKRLSAAVSKRLHLLGLQLGKPAVSGSPSLHYTSPCHLLSSAAQLPQSWACSQENQLFSALKPPCQPLLTQADQDGKALLICVHPLGRRHKPQRFTHHEYHSRLPLGWKCCTGTDSTRPRAVSSGISNFISTECWLQRPILKYIKKYSKSSVLDASALVGPLAAAGRAHYVALL